MRFFLFMILLIPLPATAQERDIRAELGNLTRSVREAEKQSAAIEAELNKLKEEEAALYNSAKKNRYEAARAYHALEVLKRSPHKYIYLLPDGSYRQYFFDMQKTESARDILMHRIRSQTENILTLRDKQADISEYMDRREMLSLTLNAGLEQMKTLNKSRETSQAFKDLVDELKSESDSLDGFMRLLLNLPEPKITQDAPLLFSLPVSGTVTNDSYGILIKAAPSSLVTAPERGQVVYAGDFQKLGPIVIMNHGGGYVSILKNFGEIFVNEGFVLQKNEPVGVLPQKDRDKSGNSPMLYYELRYNNSIINPIEKITGL